MPTKNAGLTSSAAAMRLEEYGPNKLPEKPPPSDIRIFIAQLASPLVYVLVGAGIVTFFLGDYSDTAIIFLAVVINTVLGFFQEKKAKHALYALRQLIHPQAIVIRDGERKKISVQEVVVGDVCVLEQGSKMPADGRLIEANRLFVSEALLTGESIPVAKEIDDKAFMGTIVTAGQGLMEVEVTGAKTEVGKIALQVQDPEENTPLHRQLAEFSKLLTYLVVGLTIFVFLAGTLLGKEPVEIFTTSVALAVSAIPEGLLVGLTVVLAIGMQKILKQKGLVRNLLSAETLGGVTTICIDKTGTLTEGKMRVVEVIGDKHSLAKQALIANDRDDPVVIAAWEWASKYLSNKDLKGENIDNYLAKHPRVDSIPFSSKDRFFTSLNKVGPKTKVLFMNGAPEFLLEWSDLSASEKKEIKEKMDELTRQGKRLLGMAKKKVPFTTKVISKKKAVRKLEWVGLIALSDPVREGVADALEKTRQAQVKLVVITGDYAQTAVSVIQQLGFEVDDKSVIVGSELAKYSPDSLGRKLRGEDGITVFARTTPSQKLKIVQALKANGEVVAMMGDGVNDAPALSKADIGIVVGEATDVAKESADLVLLDSQFSTIVSAIEEGRGLFNNIRKIIMYLMSDAFEEIVAVVGSIILQLPLPITAAQILWINLVSDGFPHLALTIDPITSDVMKLPPRNPKEKLVAGWMKDIILIVSLTGGLIALLVFMYFLDKTGDVALSRSVAFATLGVNSLIYVFSVRTLKKPFWRENPFENGWLIVAVIGGLIIQVLPFLFEFSRKFLEIEILDFDDWVVVFGSAIFMFIIIEVLKAVFRERLHREEVVR